MWRKRLRHRIVYLSIRGFLQFINFIPRRTALSICDVLGRIAYHAARETRLRTISHLKLAYAVECPGLDAARMAVSVFRNLGRNAVDVLRMRKLDSATMDRLISHQGLSYLEEAYGRGEGVLAVSGHIGNFELLGTFLAMRGFRVTVVATTLHDERLDALLQENRSLGGLTVVPRSHATSAVLRALRRGEVVGLLVDQDTRVPGVFVEFFNKPAFTPIGPVVIAGRTGAPIVPMGIHRLEDDTHLVTVRPPIDVEKRPSERSIVAVTQRYTSELEVLIRRAPAQWVWMHERWKTKPPGE